MAKLTVISPGQITRLLSKWRQGDEDAEAHLLRLIYPRLRAIAAGRLRGAARPPTLQTSDVVQEAYLKLVGQRQAEWQNRAQFFAVAARLMRRIVLDHARRQRRAKRQGEWRRVTLSSSAAAAAAESAPEIDWVDLDEAMRELATIDARAERIVELRYFAGMTTAEVAEVLGVSRSTVVRDWRFARAWLEGRLGEDPPP